MYFINGHDLFPLELSHTEDSPDLAAVALNRSMATLDRLLERLAFLAKTMPSGTQVLVSTCRHPQAAAGRASRADAGGGWHHARST